VSVFVCITPAGEVNPACPMLLGWSGCRLCRINPEDVGGPAIRTRDPERRTGDLPYIGAVSAGDADKLGTGPVRARVLRAGYCVRLRGMQYAVREGRSQARTPAVPWCRVSRASLWHGHLEAVSKRLRPLAGLQDVVVRVTEVPIRSMPLLPNWIFETPSSCP